MRKTKKLILNLRFNYSTEQLHSFFAKRLDDAIFAEIGAEINPKLPDVEKVWIGYELAVNSPKLDPRYNAFTVV